MRRCIRIFCGQCSGGCSHDLMCRKATERLFSSLGRVLGDTSGSWAGGKLGGTWDSGQLQVQPLSEWTRIIQRWCMVLSIHIHTWQTESIIIEDASLSTPLCIQHWRLWECSNCNAPIFKSSLRACVAYHEFLCLTHDMVTVKALILRLLNPKPLIAGGWGTGASSSSSLLQTAWGISTPCKQMTIL